MRRPAGASTERAAPAEMRVALYTPTQRSDARAPHGGPRLLGLITRALELAGHQVLVPSDFRSDEDADERRRQTALERRGAQHLVKVYRDLPAVARPEAWLICGLHPTAPDLIGPAVADTLGIPYLLVGASHARAEAGGAHADWLALTARAIAYAKAVLSLTAEDEESLRPLVAHASRLHRLALFLDPAPYRAGGHDEARRALAA